MSPEYKSITIKDSHGRDLYFPREYQLMRYAGAAVCRVASQTFAFRHFLEQLRGEKKISEEIYAVLKPFAAQIPCEEEFRSGKIIAVNDALIKLIRENLDEEID